MGAKIIDRGRGPEIAGTRITVYDVMNTSKRVGAMIRLRACFACPRRSPPGNHVKTSVTSWIMRRLYPREPRASARLQTVRVRLGAPDDAGRILAARGARGQ